MLAVALPRLKTGFSDKTVVRVPRRTDKSSSRRLWFGFGLSLGGSRLALQAAFAEYLFLDTPSSCSGYLRRGLLPGDASQYHRRQEPVA